MIPATLTVTWMLVPNDVPHLHQSLEFTHDSVKNKINIEKGFFLIIIYPVWLSLCA